METPDRQFGRKRIKKPKLAVPQAPSETPIIPEERQKLAERAETQLPMELSVPEPEASAPVPEPKQQTVPEPEPSAPIDEPEPQAIPEPKSEPKVEPARRPAAEARPAPERSDTRREAPPERPQRDRERRRPERGERFRPPQQQERRHDSQPPVQRTKERPQPRRFVPERGKVRVSIIIPAFNEEGNIKPLMDQFHEVIARVGNDWEVILVDDGSTDKTADRARDAAIHYHWLRVISYSKNRGLTAALDTGFQNARGSIFVFYPADLQYHPQEIPKMLVRIDRGADIVTGWKQGKYNKRIVSSIYNYLCRSLFGLKVHDLNSVKAFKKEVLDKVQLRRDWHRYMVVLAANEGFIVDEVKVNVYPRYSGKSKFGTGRILGGVLDLLSVKFQLSFTKKPLRFFGTWGLVSILLGFITGLIAIYLRFFTTHGSRTWLYLVILFVLSGLMLFSLGFLAEVTVSIREEIEALKRKK